MSVSVTAVVKGEGGGSTKNSRRDVPVGDIGGFFFGHGVE